ncbi:hypothetical protein GALMADRAFT_257369, partial [Galerina marginata CBS 339.88]
TRRVLPVIFSMYIAGLPSVIFSSFALRDMHSPSPGAHTRRQTRYSRSVLPNCLWSLYST